MKKVGMKDLAGWPRDVTPGRFSLFRVGAVSGLRNDALVALKRAGLRRIWRLEDCAMDLAAIWLSARCDASLAAAGSDTEVRTDGPFERL